MTMNILDFRKEKHFLEKALEEEIENVIKRICEEHGVSINSFADMEIKPILINATALNDPAPYYLWGGVVVKLFID